MTKKELSQLYYLNREIDADKRELAKLRAAAGVTGLPHVSASDTEGYKTLIQEQIELIDAKTRQTIILYNRLNRYIATVPDSLMRQILTYRHIHGLTWKQVAARIGGGNTADSVRMMHKRFLDGDASCSFCSPDVD